MHFSFLSQATGQWEIDVCLCMQMKTSYKCFAHFSSHNCLFTLGLLLSHGEDKSSNKFQSHYPPSQKMTGFCHWVQHEACASPGLIPIYITIQIRVAQGHWRGRGKKMK